MLSNKGYLLPKTKLEQYEILKLKNDLSVCPIINGKEQYSERFFIYRESETRFRIPRFYGILNFGVPSQNNTYDGISIDVDFCGTLNTKTSQPDACKQCISRLHCHGGGILSLGTGFGKTTCALYILAALKRKTIIIVHKNFLMNQWVERIKQFLPTASIGILQGSKADIHNKDIVIAMLQSLCMKEYPPNFFDSFGFTIIDEAHHIGSKVFSQALFNVCTKYILGLSATPTRKDGLTKVLNWFVGDIIFEASRKNQTHVQVYPIRIYEFADEKVPLNVSMKLNLPEVINIICNNSNRNKKILNIIQECLAQHRKIIILSDRRKHCEYLCETIQKNLPVEKTAGLYIGQMKPYELKENEQCDVIFATYSFACEGLDIPSLNTLILATPKTDIIQSIGRILRETGEKTHSPKIYDLIDHFGPLCNMYQKRLKTYKSLKIDIVDSAQKLETKTTKKGFIFKKED